MKLSGNRRAVFILGGCFLFGIYLIGGLDGGKLSNLAMEEKSFLTQNMLQCFVEKSLVDEMLLNPGKQKRGIGKFLCSITVAGYLIDTPSGFLEEGTDTDISPLISYMVGKQNGVAPTAVYGDRYVETENGGEETDEETDALTENLKMIEKLETEKNRTYLLNHFYIKDAAASIDPKIFQVETLLTKDMSIKKNSKVPQILIYHTHAASESFIDSREGKDEDSVIGVGTYLTELLTEKYGFNVVHDTTKYDLINGKIDRSQAYNVALESLEEQLKTYPDIKVIIDLHRDGVGNKVQRTTTVNGKRTAQVMLFNGLSRNSDGPIKYLPNKNLQSNLAFSLQLKIAAMKLYPDFTKPIYLRDYRYNLHLKPRSLLIELGNENNTVEEAKNAMEPLAEVLNQVLSR